MHREDNSKFLLYIEPKKEFKSIEPVNDEWIDLMNNALKDVVTGTANYSSTNVKEEFNKNGAWRGMHITECGKWSSNKDYLLFNGMITNALCIFYLQYYRDVIPESEWIKLKQLKKDYESSRI